MIIFEEMTDMNQITLRPSIFLLIRNLKTIEIKICEGEAILSGTLNFKCC
jgi:hypothetical protein